jgi:hypothetical protein
LVSVSNDFHLFHKYALPTMAAYYLIITTPHYCCALGASSALTDPSSVLPPANKQHWPVIHIHLNTPKSVN